MYKKSLNYLLNRSAVFLNLDTKYFAKAGFYSGIQQGIGVISGIVISYFFGHFIPKNIFGEYNLILSIVGFLTIITLPGLDNYLIRSIGQKYDTSYIRSFIYKLKFASVSLPIILTISLYYFLNNQSILAYGFIIAALFLPILEPLQLFNEFLIAKKKFMEITFYQSLSSVLSVILICFAIYFSGSLVMVLLAYFLAIFIPSLLGFSNSLKYIHKTQKNDKDLLNMGLIMTGLNILPWCASYLGLIILTAFLGPELLAIFVVAQKLPLYMQKNLFVFHKPITAKLAGQSHKEHLNTLKKHFLKLVLWGFVISLPIYFLSPYIIQFIFTQKYDKAIPLTQLLAFSLIPLPITWVTNDIIVFQKRIKPQLYASLAVSVIRIILYFILIPAFKLYGLVFVYLFDRYVTLAINLIIIKNNQVFIKK